MLFRLGTMAAAVAIAAAAQEAALDRFEKKIRPVLAARCYACHSASAAAPQGGLLLDSTNSIQRGGNSGDVIQPGNPEQSLLIRAIRYTDKKLKMPPGNPLPPDVVARRRGLDPRGRAAARRSGYVREDAARSVVSEKAGIARVAGRARAAVDTQRHRSLHLEPARSQRPQTLARSG